MTHFRALHLASQMCVCVSLQILLAGGCYPLSNLPQLSADLQHNQTKLATQVKNLKQVEDKSGK